MKELSIICDQLSFIINNHYRNLSAIVFAIQFCDVPRSQNMKCFLICCDFIVHRHRVSFIFSLSFQPRLLNYRPIFAIIVANFLIWLLIKSSVLPSEVMLRPWAEAVRLGLVSPWPGSLSTLAELLSNICWPEALERGRWTEDWALNNIMSYHRS